MYFEKWTLAHDADAMKARGNAGKAKPVPLAI
jgi:hypothetical protein